MQAFAVVAWKEEWRSTAMIGVSYERHYYAAVGHPQRYSAALLSWHPISRFASFPRAPQARLDGAWNWGWAVLGDWKQ